MEERELLLKEIKGLIADSQKENVNKADLEKTIKELNERIAKLDNADIKALKESVDKVIQATADNAAAIKALAEVPAKKDQKPMTFKEALVAAVQEAAKNVPSLLVEKNDDLGKRQSLKDYFAILGNKNTPEMVIKTDMTEANIVQSNVATVRLTELDPNRVTTPLTIYSHVLDWMPVKGITKKYMSLLVVYSYSDGAGTKTQGSTATISSFLLKTVEFVSATIGTKFRVTDESLDDLPEVMEEIALVGPSKIKDNVDYQILGSAGDDTATIKGLFAASKHTDFTGSTTYAATIVAANEIDVIATMKLQAAASNYKLTDVIMSPTDVHIIAAQKDQLDNSRIDRRVAFDALGNPVAVCGLMIRENAKMSANTVVGVDRAMLQIGDRKQMTLEVGYDGNDFTEGFKTVRINVRLAFGVRDPLAVIYCDDLSTAVTNITKA
jgi:hypothetical protein